ncbi:MAG: nucleotidyltransferase family protein [Planctomycetota bacterium]|jgi:glucose-1-phosphate thymidylyltransferase|nr:nucleotidyltransferase family protein [Planctomycetota bacterium]
MKAIALAAGFATRLYPLTKDRPKPLLDVAGRPVLSWLLDRVLAVPDIDEVVVVTNARFHADFEQWRDDYACHVPIRVINDGATNDTDPVGAIRDLALGWRALEPNADVLVAAGDNLLRFALEPYVDAFLRAGTPTLLARRLQGGMPPGRFGEITTDETGRITRFREKPKQPESDLAATCLYLLPAPTRDLLETYVARGRDLDAPGNFIAWLAQQTEVHAAEFDAADMFDIGNKETLENARRLFRG